MKPPLVIAIDGPSATGKGSVSRELARRVGFLHVDTGVMYRALTWHCLRTGVFPAEKIEHLSTEQSAAVARMCASWPVKIVPTEGELCVLVDGYRPLTELRQDEVARRRMEELGAKASAGRLSAKEEREYDALIEVSDVIATLQLKARQQVAEARPE